MNIKNFKKLSTKEVKEVKGGWSWNGGTYALCVASAMQRGASEPEARAACIRYLLP